eukprot:s3585_g9.t1
MMQLGHTNQSVPLLRPHLLSISGLYISRNPTHLARAIVPALTWPAFEASAMEDWRARWPIPHLRALWSVVRPPLVRYREIAPAAGLIYAIWQRRQWQKQTELQALAVREGRFMEQCSILLVNLEGLTCGANLSSTTLFIVRILWAFARATPSQPLLELGGDGWLVMANINAHLMEALGSSGHAAAACGFPVRVVEFLYALVNDRTTKSRQQLRVYVVRESDLRNIPEAAALDLRRSSHRNAYGVLQSMARSYSVPPPQMRKHNDLRASERHGPHLDHLPAEGAGPRTAWSKALGV